MDHGPTQPIERRPEADVDLDGGLATGLFIGTILLLIVLIYALASAA